MGRPSRRGRDIDGIVLLDKALELSSNDLLQRVKRLFRANKAGHTGALDPLATGMLPVCLGEATKFSQHLLETDKRYRVTARLGERIDTSDAEGQTLSVRPVSLDQARLEAALDHFRGESRQVPVDVFCAEASGASAVRVRPRRYHGRARGAPHPRIRFAVTLLGPDGGGTVNSLLQRHLHPHHYR